MNPIKNIYFLFKELYENVEGDFSAIFLKSKPVISITNIEINKKKSIEDKLSHLIEKSQEIEEVYPDFHKKYLYAEGKDIAIFVYYVDEDITVGSIFLKKPKFAAVLLEHEIFSKKIKENEYFFNALKSINPENFDIEQALKDEKQNEEPTEKNIEEKEHCEIIVEREEEEEIVPSLEELIEESINEYEKNQKLADNKRRLEEKVKKEREEKDDYVPPIILEHIEKEFVNEIGPIAKLILNRKMTELNINPDRLTTEDVTKLINELAKEIRIEEKKEKFINETHDLL